MHKLRRLLQRMGTEVGRELFGQDFWVELAMRKLDGPTVFTDCRFPNEYWALAAAGFTFVRITADTDARLDRLHIMGKETTREQLDDESEHAIDGFPADITIVNDGDKVAYIEQLTSFLGVMAGRQ